MRKLYDSAKDKIYILFFFSIIAFVFTLPVFLSFDNWGIQDWDQHLFYHAVPRLTILEYGQFPLWNPYYCGGTVLLANPQSRFLSPSFLFILLFGEVRGIKLEIWLHLVIGLLGIYALARQYNLDRVPAILASSVFMLNSMYALNLTVGMTWFLSVAYLPWAFLFYLWAVNDWRYALLSGLFLVLMFFGGGAYPLAITGLFLGFYSLLVISFKEYSPWKVARSLLITLAFALCLGAVKFLPAAEFLGDHPRRIYDYSGFSLNSLRFGLFSRDQTLGAIARLPIEEPGFVNGVTGGMDENGMYTGAIPFVLFLVGIGLHDKRRMVLALCFIFFLWLSFGNRSRPIELWTLLHLSPVYDSMRIAQRFRIVFMLCLAIFAGFGLQTASCYVSRLTDRQKLALLFTPAVVLIVLMDLLVVNWQVLKDAFPIPPLESGRTSAFYQVWELPSYNKEGWLTSNLANTPSLDDLDDPSRLYSSFGSLYPAFLSNIGTINCYESANVPRNAAPISSPSYKGEAYLLGTEGSVQVRDWSPNRVVLDVNAASDGFLVLNQNYYPGWHVEGAGEAKPQEVNGLLGVRISTRAQHIEMYYLPGSFTWGVAVTLAAAVFGLIMGVRGRRVRSPGG